MVGVAVSSGHVIVLDGLCRQFNRGLLIGICILLFSMGTQLELRLMASRKRNHGGSLPLHCLASNLAALNCTHSSHAPLQGKWTRMPAFYHRKLCNLMTQSLFPHVVDQHVCSMPCVARSQQSHRQKLVPGYPSVPLDIAMFSVGCKEVATAAYVHRLLDRSEWID